MISFLKQKIWFFVLGLLLILWCCVPSVNFVEAAAPQYERDFSSQLGDYVLASSNFWVDSDKTLRENIADMFYPRSAKGDSKIYEVIRDITLWVMIIFFVWAWASLLLNKKPDEAKKHLYSLLYIMLWWVLVYGSNWLFWEVFNFNWSDFTTGQTWLGWFTETLIGKVAFLVLSAVKAAAFFFAIIMTAITGFALIFIGTLAYLFKHRGIKSWKQRKEYFSS